MEWSRMVTPYEAALEQQIAEKEKRIAELNEALHEIYSKACQAMNEDDDMYLYSFAQDARDIALKAGGGK